MRHTVFSLLLLLLLLFIAYSCCASDLPGHFFKPGSASLIQNAEDEYLELAKPVTSSEPNCSLLLFQHDFADTMGLPPLSTQYSPPENCSVAPPWTKAVLEFSASCRGEQYDRIAAIWLDGVEILRTSTAEPTESGIFWKVQKDVTRYTSLLLRSNLTLTVMLENLVNDVYTGVYHVNVSLFYYHGETNAIQTRNQLKLASFRKLLQVQQQKQENFIYETPADLILPISETNGDHGFWYQIQNELDVRFKDIQIPNNTYRAVLEIYVSFHGNDEFWYTNPPDSYIHFNNLTTGRGNGAFRHVFVTVDGVSVGSVLPFPVIFTGGINPLFWEPVVAIGAFNLPSYDLHFSPFLGLLLDGKTHSLGIGVGKSIPFWLVDANLHLWLDSTSPSVRAKSVKFSTPDFSLKIDSKFKNLDGKFKIKAERKTEFCGWVSSSLGNLTTTISHKFKFKSSIKFKNSGQFKEVEQKIKIKTEVKVESDTGELLTQKAIKSEYPTNVLISTQPGPQNNTYIQTTNVSHALGHEYSVNSPTVDVSSFVHNNQVSGGWMLVQDHSVLSGDATTNQTLVYRDEAGCYSQTVYANNGKLLEDTSSLACAPSM